MAIAGGLASVIGLVYVLTRDAKAAQGPPDPLVGREVRISIGRMTRQLTFPDFLLTGAPGTMIVRVIAVDAATGKVRGEVTSFDGFTTIFGKSLPPGLIVEFDREAIQP